MGVPHINELPERLGSAAPWWIAIGVTGVSVAILSGSAPLLASLTLIGIGSDADLSRRLREALEAEEQSGRAPQTNPAIVAGLVRRVHAGMYLLLVAFAWASLLHLTGQTVDSSGARWWLAGDLVASAVLVFGYARLNRRS